MRTILRLVPVFLLMIGAAPDVAAEAVHMWKCETEETVNDSEVKAAAVKWLTAAKTMPGGAAMEASVYFPVAVNDAADTDIWFVISTPTFEDWGKFWDAYPGSAAEAIDDQNVQAGIFCPDSAVFESAKIE